MLKLLQLRQRPIPTRRVQNHGLRSGRADFHPGCFTLSCELKVVALRSRDVTLRFPNQTPSSPRLHLQILSLKTTNRTEDKQQGSWWDC